MASDLIDFLKAHKPQNSFTSRPYYSKEGDFLTFFFENRDNYAERMDDVLTVYRDMEDDRFVGFKLKGVALLLKTWGDMLVRVLDEKGLLRLNLLLIAATMKTKEHSVLRVYQKFERKTRRIRLRTKELIPA